MDTLTHAMAGALLARATAPRLALPGALPLPRRVAVGFLAAAAPDLDFVTGYVSPLAYIYYHRGITHSMLLLPLWAVLLALVFAALWRFKPGWRAYVFVTAGALASHIVLDLITSFGTMIFAPLSDARYALSTTFIIDLWLSGILLAGLVLSLFWRRSRAPALAGVAVLVAYVGMQAALHHRAVDFGEAYARERGLEGSRVSAVPRPVSPFNWTVIVSEDSRYHYAHVNLLRKRVSAPRPDSGFVETLNGAYRPLSDPGWMQSARFGSAPAEVALAREAFGQRRFGFFRWFATYPIALAAAAGGGNECVWFADLRFVTPGRLETPFRYGMCREGGGEWAPFQFVGDGKRPVF